MPKAVSWQPLRSRARWFVVAAAVVAGAVHVPVTGPHLEEAPYMGVSFILLTVACLGLAATLVVHDAPPVYAASGTVCGLAVLGYIATRLVAFPQLADDVGNWLEPLGVVAVLSELVVVAMAARVPVRRGGMGTSPSRRTATPAA